MRLIATSMPVELSMAVYTVPDAPWPIFSILAYFLVGSPTLTIVLSFSKISSSVIFFFLAELRVWFVGGSVWPVGDVTIVLMFAVAVLLFVVVVVAGGVKIAVEFLFLSNVGLFIWFV